VEDSSWLYSKNTRISNGSTHPKKQASRMFQRHKKKKQKNSNNGINSFYATTCLKLKMSLLTRMQINNKIGTNRKMKRNRNLKK